MKLQNYASLYNTKSDNINLYKNPSLKSNNKNNILNNKTDYY